MSTNNNKKKACLDDMRCCASVLDTVQEPILMLDKNYRIVDANEPVCNKFKCETENIIGKHCYEIANNSNEPCFERGMPCPVKIALETGQQARVIHEHTQPDNKIIFEQMLASPVKDKEGQISLLIEEIRDVTELLKSKEKKRFLPICASCKKFRNEKGDWEHIERYIQKHSPSDLTHTICPECRKKIYPEY
jgi:transcriptional regulator with PAS, ATPase and Fis domain